ncbi:hypothetical protein [Thermococcus sp. Bubb.Bath]|uniref:hypothetical protein n=1 Tax=Thermococcus sp. Bubb.Bath TaxID=1638242 RepID=UPI001439385F|nr:hypothetical protein [Thermococcus sp. Bubb.Bath]NJF25962.1 hypothetical protein [Thermococcus sp. Bubb.Bath]
MDSKTILSRFFDRNVSVLNATRTALSYPLLSSRDYGVLYIQVAAPLKDWAVNACLNHIRKSLVESSGLELLVYTAVNFEHPINNVSKLEPMVKETIPDRIFPKALWNAYRGVQLYRNRTVYLDIRSPTSNRRMFYSNGTYHNYSTSELWTLADNGSIVIPTTVSVEQKDIVDLLKDSGEYVLKFFVGYSGLLMTLYLPLFMLLIYASSRFYQQLMKDLDILSLRGIRRNYYRVVDLAIFVACTLAVLASYELVIALYSKAPSALVAGAVILVSYSIVLLSKKINGRGLKNCILPLLTASFILLGYLRINNEVLMARGWGFLVIFLAFLYALTPLMGVYYGVLSEQVVRKLVGLFQSRNPLPYYERILKEYTLVLAFSAYPLAIGLLPKLISLEKVTDRIAGSSDYFNLVGYSNVSILGLLNEYLKELALIFGLTGLVVGFILISVMLSKYKEAKRYSKLRGIDEAMLKKQTIRSLFVFVLILTASMAVMLLLVALFTDAYVGFNYTEGKIVVEGGRLVVKSLFKPPHIFIWG